MYQNLNEQAEYIKNNFSKTIEILSPIENQNLIIYVDKNHIEDFLTFLRDDDNLSFKSLIEDRKSVV